MNIEALENYFDKLPEVEIVRLMTGNFNSGVFALIAPNIPKDIATGLTKAIKFRNHLSLAPTGLVPFLDKMESLERYTNIEFKGKVNKHCGFSGELVHNSKTLVGTPDELVSPNEYEYYLKLYPWYTEPSNPAFNHYVDQYVNKQAFFCLDSFDESILLDKEDVVKLSSKGIHLANKTIIPIIRVS